MTQLLLLTTTTEDYSAMCAALISHLTLEIRGPAKALEIHTIQLHLSCNLRTKAASLLRKQRSTCEPNYTYTIIYKNYPNPMMEKRDGSMHFFYKNKQGCWHIMYPLPKSTWHPLHWKDSFSLIIKYLFIYTNRTDPESSYCDEP